MPELVTSQPFTLAIDAMGGDRAPGVVLDGLEIAAERHPQARFLLVGDEAVLAPMIAQRRRVAASCTVRHTAAMIPSDMKPTQALRVRGSSMRVAIDAVADGEAQGVVSAGNTGALLALAKIVIKTLPGIARPAMAAIGPSARGDVVMLDLGANVQCDARNLVEFAIMGRRVRAHRAGADVAQHRAAERGRGGDEGRRAGEAGRRRAADEPPGRKLPWFRRGQRHRERHGGRGGDGRVHGQRGAEDRGRAR